MVNGGAIPQFFRNTGERSISTYNYEDVVSGLGYQEFIGWINYTDEENIYLTPSGQEFYTKNSTGQEYDFIRTTSSSYVSFTDRTFTTSEFNSQRVLNGVGYLVLPIQVNTATSHTEYTGKVTVTVSGSVTGEIFTDTIERAMASNDSESWSIVIFPMTFNNDIISVGETISIQIQGWVKRTAGTGTILGAFGYSAQDNDLSEETAYPYVAMGPSSNGTSKFSAYLPFKIDL